MNFLSHYYFDRFAQEPEQVLGGLLPDLLKNVDKRYSYQLHKYGNRLAFHPKSILIGEGWDRHVLVDKLFHSSDFFFKHTHVLRSQIAAIITDLPIRPSFLAHISLELLLDHLLIEHQILKVARLYEHLSHIDRDIVTKYLMVLDPQIDIGRFFSFYDRFLASRYIFDYANIDNLPHALFNICKRIWDFKPSTYHLEQLSLKLQVYKETKMKEYKDIYLFIQDKVV